jgi:hypothetical protein
MMMIKAHPTLILGGKSIDRLMLFCLGFSSAIEQSYSYHFWFESLFEEYINNKFYQPGGLNSFYQIAQDREGEEAVDLYFEEYESFIKEYDLEGYFSEKLQTKYYHDKVICIQIPDNWSVKKESSIVIVDQNSQKKMELWYSCDSSIAASAHLVAELKKLIMANDVSLINEDAIYLDKLIKNTQKKRFDRRIQECVTGYSKSRPGLFRYYIVAEADNYVIGMYNDNCYSKATSICDSIICGARFLEQHIIH